jgi:hypothetical protein
MSGTLVLPERQDTVPENEPETNSQERIVG